MDIEMKDAPLCCQHTAEQIADTLDATALLAELVAIAPSLSVPAPPPRASAVSLLWRLASRGKTYVDNRKAGSTLVTPVARGKLRTLIGLEQLKHNNDPELSKRWANISRLLDI